MLRTIIYLQEIENRTDIYNQCKLVQSANNGGSKIDISRGIIESCCKTILIDHAVDITELKSTNKLVKEVINTLVIKSERQFIGNLTGCISALSNFRNNYGIISHGKDLKSNDKVNEDFAELLVSFVDALVLFLLKSDRRSIAIKKRWMYEDFEEFNKYYDGLNPLESSGIVLSASRALFDQDFEVYKEEYFNYLNEKEANYGK